MHVENYKITFLHCPDGDGDGGMIPTQWNEPWLCVQVCPPEQGGLHLVTIVAKKRDPGILDPEFFLAQIRKVEARLGKLAKIRKVETD